MITASVLAVSAQSPAHAGGTLVKCYGIARWPVKTLADKPTLQAAIVDKTVAALWPLAPSHPVGDYTARQTGFETTIYRVTATLKYARHVDDPADANGKNGGDLDYHLVIADINQPAKTMIVEFPDPHCTLGATAARRMQMAKARTDFETECGGAPKHAFTNLSGKATITGVGFYDIPHAKGRAQHGVELHPILSFSSTNCHWVH